MGVVIPLAVAAVLAPPPDDTRDRTDLRADLRRFAADMPTTSGYTRPSRAERATIRDGLRHVLGGHRNHAETTLAGIGYVLRRRVDSGTGRPFDELSDATERSRGWGRVVVDLGSTVQVGLEVPHPGADLGSEALGAELFRRVPGSVLVVAGAHRRAAPERWADVAHAPDSAFQAVHELLVRHGLPVIQLHGFRNETAPGCGVVVSAGPELRSPYVDRLAARLESAGLSVCRAWRPGCHRALAGTTNVQARFSAARGGDFAHVEVSREVRDSDEARERVVSALSRQAVAW
ncbi:hypothetical protein [Actinophytocola xanthii]|uniref:N-formylglutamate amidohydrolase n=1 Tax=Actinophytocola xanthii TaxID=1912961 RepID=A0A1Q8CXU6_9PSEU|nr:hypothetical protein [Actinophytocola xanthii]OLF19177.1 hypothetical protein BU204_02095 [Actinophytocola xanthii]